MEKYNLRLELMENSQIRVRLATIYAYDIETAKDIARKLYKVQGWKKINSVELL